jgi:hypothetical protein
LPSVSDRQLWNRRRSGLVARRHVGRDHTKIPRP